MHSPSTTPLIALPSFHVLNFKQYYRLLEFLDDTLVYMQPEVLNIGTLLKMFKNKVIKFLNQKFLKLEVLKKMKLNCILKLV